MTTVQLTLEGKIYYKNKCIYCGKGFKKTANKQLYCSDSCLRKTRKNIKQHINIVAETYP